MAGMKSLAKDTVIYGGSTILVKMITYLLITLFTYTLAKEDFGIMTNVYAYVALFMVVLTFGMETGFFRFANQKEKYNPTDVYSTAIIAVGSVVCLFIAVFLFFLPEIKPILWKDEIPESYIRLVLIIMSLDAFSAIPFAYLRFKQRPVKFAALKIVYIVLYTIFCLFFLLLCPWIYKNHPQLISWFYIPEFKLGYVFLSNFIATFIQTCCLLPELTGFRYRFDGSLMKKMLRYSFPLLILGIAGMSNQIVDKLVFPVIYPDQSQAFGELGIYSACFKIALIMMMYTQAFRYAFEPFIFAKTQSLDNKQAYADATKYFILLGLLTFLGVVFYLDIIKYLIAPEYWDGLPVVSIVLMGELFFGIYFNLSLWYKLTDKTYWGAILSVIACMIIVCINVFFIPRYGYMACAWAPFIGYLFIMLISYFMGQKVYPIPYHLKTIGFYFLLAGLLYAVSRIIVIENTALRLSFHTLLLGIYIFILLKRDLPLNQIIHARPTE